MKSLSRPSSRERRAVASVGRLDGKSAPRLACKPSARSNLEETFAFQVKAYDLVVPVREFKFDPKRRWRADFAWPHENILVELEGGVWSGGRHTRGNGFIDDCIKYNQAAFLGYKVFRFTSEHVKSGEAIRLVAKLIPVASEIWPRML